LAVEDVDFDIAAANDDIRRLHRAWQERRTGRPYPAGADIDLASFHFARDYLSLIEICQKPWRFRYRVVAAGVTRHLGYEMTGHDVEDVPEPETRAYVKLLYTRAVWKRAPLYEKGRITLDGRRWDHETLVLPLSSDGETIDMLLIYRKATVRQQGESAVTEAAR
jgi:hypothetical protein